MRCQCPYRALLIAAVPALLLACGFGTVELPPGTVLVVELTEGVDPAEVEVGSRISARLAGDLTAEDRILIPAGAVLRGQVTAVQPADERLPAAVKIDFRTLETGSDSVSVEARVTSAEARTAEGAGDGAGPDGTMGLAGTVVEGREHAPMVGPELSGAAGTGILLGTDARPAHLPAGSRIEMELTAPLEIVPPDGEG